MVNGWALLPPRVTQRDAPELTQPASALEVDTSTPPQIAVRRPATARRPQRPAPAPVVTSVLTPEQPLHAALERATRSCMAARGFDYRVRERADDPDPLPALPLAERTAYRHALKGGELDEHGQRGSDVVVIELEPGVSAVWDRTSCRAQAERDVFGDDLAYQRALLAAEQRQEQRATLARRDPEYLAALEQFQHCLRSSVPEELPGASPRELYEAHRRGEVESLTADAAEHCRVLASLESRWSDALLRASSQVPDEQERAQLARIEQAALARTALWR